MADEIPGVPPESPTSPETPPEPQMIPQDRFNEVYAEKKNMERMVQELQAQNAAFSSQMAEMASRAMQAQAPREVAPQAPESLDPAADAYIQRKLDAQLQQFSQRQEAMLAQMQGQLSQARYASELQGLPQDVALEAERLISVWKQQGKTGWELPDAIQVVLGGRAQQALKKGDASARALVGLSNAPASSAALQRLQSQVPGSIPHAAPPAPRAPVVPAGEEPDFDTSDPEQAAKMLSFYGGRVR